MDVESWLQAVLYEFTKNIFFGSLSYTKYQFFDIFCYKIADPRWSWQCCVHFTCFHILSWFLVNIWGAAQNGTAYIQKVMGVQIYGIPYNYKLIFSCIIAASSSPKNFKMVPLLHKWCQMVLEHWFQKGILFDCASILRGARPPKKGPKSAAWSHLRSLMNPATPLAPYIYTHTPFLFYYIV